MEARIAVNATEIAILKKELEQLRDDNKNDHLILEEKIDYLTTQVIQLVERGKVERESEKRELKVRMWLIALFTSIVTFIVTWITHK